METSPEVSEQVVLDPVGAGQQGYVFGTETWVVKIRRISLFSVLARWVSRRRWNQEVGDALGGLVAPFLLLEEVEFTAPKMTGRERLIEYQEKWATIMPRYDDVTFLDHRLSLAEPREALALVREMMVLVERVRARGFYMHDFIMKNFVVVEGKLLIADTGLIVPMRSFWEPAMRICAWGLWRGLSKDYQRLLGELLDEVGDDEALRAEIIEFRKELPSLVGRLRKCEIRDLEIEPAVKVEFDPELEKEIRGVLGSVR